jgi:putative ABC transport system ATP-binding protein
MSAEIVLTGVTKSYGTASQRVAVLEDVSLRCAQGDFLALMGPSGSGKTTLLNIIAGLDTVDKGEVRVFGKNLEKLSDAQRTAWRARNVGFVFQFYNLLPTLRADQNVEVPLMLMKMSAADRARRVAAALELVGLSNRARHRPPQLSGGQLQRVAIARAIVADANLMICDEPTGDLDRRASEEVLSLLQMLCREHGKTILLVTHDPFAAAYASRTVLLEKELEGGSHLVHETRPTGSGTPLRVGQM